MRAREILSWNLRKYRVARGLSQEKLAADMGMDRAYLGGIERGAENPSLDSLERLAEALDIALTELLRLPAPGEQVPRPLRPGRRGQ